MATAIAVAVTCDSFCAAGCVAVLERFIDVERRELLTDRGVSFAGATRTEISSNIFAKDKCEYGTSWCGRCSERGSLTGVLVPAEPADRGERDVTDERDERDERRGLESLNLKVGMPTTLANIYAIAVPSSSTCIIFGSDI